MNLYKTSFFLCIFIIGHFLWVFGQNSNSEVRKIGILKGELAPNIIALDNHGDPFLLSSKLKTAPAVVVFYSGQWCKPCTDELKQIQKELYPKLKEKGVHLIGITSELPETIDQIAKNLGIEFPMIHDRSHLIMDAYKTSISYNTADGTIPVEDSNMLHRYAGEKDYTITFTAVYVIGRGGKEGKERHVYYADVNPDFKPNPKIDEITAAVEEALQFHLKHPIKREENK
ncbi:MAG: redoxin domain-containing protein [Bacteroidia bacterium]|nr:redoxin domain-containing protein [Bacteroidia bacterium]MDW8300965.1 redoxin domain-containing protein [Bacteroidia bacterium]